VTRISLTAVPAIAFAAAFVPVAGQPTCADWHVSDVTYGYAWDQPIDQILYRADGVTVIGHIWRDGGVGWYYAKAEAYGSGVYYDAVATTDPLDGQHRPLLGHSRLIARVWLEGSPPPPRPSTWLRKSYLDASHCIYCDEVDPVSGTRGMSGLSMTGLMGYSPPTQGHRFTEAWKLGAHEQYSEQSSIIDPDWVSRTTTSQYQAAWVYSRATATAKGSPDQGIVRCQVKTCASSWGIQHNP
jgi:hypothetical protein